ncbi:MAG TPA: M23 family metallopeptidase [Anaerolineales bacterium]|nr:M23 family metallopeptidase [Anaerolineales bacterium]
MMIGKRIDGLFLVAICLVAFMAFNVWQDRDVVTTAQAAAPPGGDTVAAVSGPVQDAGSQAVITAEALVSDPAMVQAVPTGEVPPSAEVDPRAFASPYDDFDLTQGPHGASYGHLAIDIAGGNGAPIKSPINGVISALYTDEWGNTTLVVENDVYQVMFLHGLYSVSLGDTVQTGDLLGTESNQGNTVDAYGQSCRGRDCGYHTHLNVFDKILGENVNPLNLIGLE